MSTNERWPNAPMQPNERTMLRFLGWLWAGLSSAAAILAGTTGGHTVAVYGFGGMGLVVVLLLTISRKSNGGPR